MGKRGPERSAIHDGVKQMYAVMGSYTKVAVHFGISRQRVHQIVAEYKNTGARRLKKEHLHLYSQNCNVCNEVPANHLHHIDFNNENDSVDNLIPVCTKCHGFIHRAHRREVASHVCISCKRDFSGKSKSFSIKASLCNYCKYAPRGKDFLKSVMYPDTCRGCKKSTKVRRRTHGYHIKCWYNSDEFRELNRVRMAEYRGNRYKIDERFREKVREYNKRATIKRNTRLIGKLGLALSRWG